MLSDLFAEEDVIGGGRMESSRVFIDGKPSSRAPPPSPRHASGICGIANQGATCYLNSLLQTLFFTTEFRERLFRLGEDQLGSLKNINGQTRIIPLQLQRLFGKLLLLDVDCASTTDLTDSFGWTNSEELQQHDVQELNRILFQAIESSLVGTAGHSLVKELYNGRIVNQIICLKCERVSEREEDFLDMNVTVSGNESLDKAFHNMYVEVEMMDGNNRYQCASCRALTDATKGMKIRALPSVFTVSLLRFSYDLVTFQRFKETGNFAFPTELDLAPYCESPPSAGSSSIGTVNEEGKTDTKYELFSVIVHKGSCYGGHYHCFIRDKDDIGKWTPPEEEKISLPTVSAGKVDYLAYDDPTDLVSALLVQTPSNSMTLDSLCAEITRVTGVSWNKRFKRQFGSITKFLRSNQNVFYFNEASKAVTLLHIDQHRLANGHFGWDNPLEVTVGRFSEASASTTSESGPEVEVSISPRHSSSASQIGPASSSSAAGDCLSFVNDSALVTDTAAAAATTFPHWFNIDDSRVKSVREDELKGQFSGKESAYMLFYRRKATYPCESVLYDLPPWLLDEVTEENHRLAQQRSEYDDDINRLSVELLFASEYDFRNGALTARSKNEDTNDVSSKVDNGSDFAKDSTSDTIADNNITAQVTSDAFSNGTKTCEKTDNQSSSKTSASNALASNRSESNEQFTASGTNEAVTDLASTALVLDRRKSIQEMIESIRDTGKEKVGENVSVNLVRQYPGGIQLLNKLFSTENSSSVNPSVAPGSPSSSSPSLTAPLSSLTGLVDGAVLFVWNGSDVNGVRLPEEVFIEPVLLEIQTQRIDEQGSPYQESLRHTFPKSMLLSEFRHQLPSILNENALRCRERLAPGSKEPQLMECLPTSASIARVRTDGRNASGMDDRGNGDTRHRSFDTFLLDRQHDDKTFLELGLVDYDTILVDLTGFSNDDFVAPLSPSANSWAAVAEGKASANVIECLDVVSSSTSSVAPSVTTDVNLPNDSSSSASSAATTAASVSAVPLPTRHSKLGENVTAAQLPSTASAVSSSANTIKVRAQIKSNDWFMGDAKPPTVEVEVTSTISVGKLKYVIIDAAEKVTAQSAQRYGTSPVVISSTTPDVSSDGLLAEETTKSDETPRLNGKLFRLRVLEEGFRLSTPLMERLNLSEAGLKEGTLVCLEKGVAPKPGQITISFTAASQVQEAEIIVDKDMAITNCISQMVSLLSLHDSAEGWHLRKTNWDGEAVEAIEDNSVTIEQEGIKDGDQFVLEEGVVPPKGFLRLPVWFLTDANRMEETANSTVEGNSSDTTQSISKFSLKLLQGKIFMSHLELTQDTILLSLKEQCFRLFEEKQLEKQLEIPSLIWPSMEGKKAGQIRIQTIDSKGIQGSVLKGHKATLKVLHVTNNVQLLVSVVDKAEDPSPSQVILRTYLRVPDSKSYESLGEILWETAGAGATAASLRTAIAKAHDFPSNEVILAKYFPEKYEWLILTDSKSVTKQTSIKKQYGKQQAKKGSTKKNLRQTPFHIQDGDVIGVKTLNSDPMHLDNFMTEEDEIGKSKLKEGEEEKRRKRQENRQRQNSESQNVIGGGANAGSGSNNKQAERKLRPEVALTIHVPKYE